MTEYNGKYPIIPKKAKRYPRQVTALLTKEQFEAFGKGAPLSEIFGRNKKIEKDPKEVQTCRFNNIKRKVTPQTILF